MSLGGNCAVNEVAAGAVATVAAATVGAAATGGMQVAITMFPHWVPAAVLAAENPVSLIMWSGVIRILDGEISLCTTPAVCAASVAARENAASGQAMGALPDFVKAIALNNKLDESREFATDVQRAMLDRLRPANKTAKDLGVKQAPFVVLIGAAMPAGLNNEPADDAVSLARDRSRARRT